MAAANPFVLRRQAARRRRWRKTKRALGLVFLLAMATTSLPPVRAIIGEQLWVKSAAVGLRGDPPYSGSEPDSEASNPNPFASAAPNWVSHALDPTVFFQPRAAAELLSFFVVSFSSVLFRSM